jgi:hypothetical protein
MDIAVVSTELLPQAPSGETYQAWARHGDVWTSLGTFVPDAAGAAQLVAQDAALTQTPDAVEITLERGGGGQTPQGQVVLAWPNA